MILFFFFFPIASRRFQFSQGSFRPRGSFVIARCCDWQSGDIPCTRSRSFLSAMTNTLINKRVSRSLALSYLSRLFSARGEVCFSAAARAGILVYAESVDNCAIIAPALRGALISEWSVRSYNARNRPIEETAIESRHTARRRDTQRAAARKWKYARVRLSTFYEPRCPRGHV